MGMQLTGKWQGDEANRPSRHDHAESSRGEFGVWIEAQAVIMIDRVRRVAKQAVERIRHAQAHGSKPKQMKLIESLALGNRRQLLLVVCDNQRYLVGAGADSVGSILALDAGGVSRDRAARGPELVRRRGRDASNEARLKAAESGLDLWH